MMTNPSIAVNPALLTWAREESGYDVERVAHRLQVKEERVRAWERGERQPTFHQAEALARFFHRPLSVFFMPRPPQLGLSSQKYRPLTNQSYSFWLTRSSALPPTTLRATAWSQPWYARINEREIITGTAV